MARKNPKRTLTVFYLYLLSMIAVPVIAGIGLYLWLLGRYEQDLATQTARVLELNQRVLDREFVDLELFFSRIGSFDAITPFASIDDQSLPGRDLLTIIDLRNTLARNYTKEGLLSIIGVFNVDAGIMVTDLPVFYFPGDYGNEGNVPVYFSLEDHSYPEWVGLVTSAGTGVSVYPAQTVTLNGAVSELIPIVTKSRIRGANTWVVAFLDIDRLLAPFAELPWYDKGWFAFGTDGQIIASIGDRPLSTDAIVERLSVGTERRLHFTLDDRSVTILKSFVTGNFFVASLPNSVVWSGLNALRLGALATMAIVVLIGILMGRMISGHLSRPILNLYDAVTGVSARTVDYFHGFEQIGERFKAMESEKQELTESVDQIRSYLTASFFDLVLDGEISSANELRDVSRFVSFPFGDYHYFAFSCLILGLPSQAAGSDLPQLLGFRQVVAQVFRNHGVVFRREENTNLHVGIVPLPADGTEASRIALRRRLLDIITEFREGYDVDCSCAASQPCADILELSARYKEILEAAGHLGIYNKEKVLWFSDIPQHSLLYYYPIEWEQSIINSVVAGDGQKSREILESIWVENVEKRSLSSVMLDRMIADLHGTVFKVITLVNRQRKIVDEESIGSSLGTRPASYKEAFDRITGAFAEIRAVVADYKKSHSQLLDQVRSYLDQHYEDANLTMDQVAEESGISKPYLSRFFKEKMGINFHQYLLDLRIARAKDLLLDRKASVTEISHLAGFGSVRSLNRSFKQATGISPREYQHLSAQSPT